MEGVQEAEEGIEGEDDTEEDTGEEETEHDAKEEEDVVDGHT